MRARAEPVSRSACGTRGAAARFRSVMGLFSRHRRGPSMGQPLLDQGADALDIMPPTPEELPPDTDAPFEVCHATRARRVRAGRVSRTPPPYSPRRRWRVPEPARRSRLPSSSPRETSTRIRLGLTAFPLARSPPPTRRSFGCAGTVTARLRSDAARGARRSSRTPTRCASRRSRSTSGDSPSP